MKKLQAADGRPREVKNCGGRKKRRLADEEASPLPLPDLAPYTDVGVADASEIRSPEQQEGEAEVSVPPILGAVVPRPGSAHSFDSVCQRFLEDNDSWYDGLGVLQPDQREEVVGLRLTTLALRLETQGLGYRTYEDTVDFLDGFFPREFGEQNHSKHFFQSVLQRALPVLHTRIAEGMHTKLTLGLGCNAPPVGTPLLVLVILVYFLKVTMQSFNLQLHTHSQEGS